jgi:cytoskeletal protein RodZ
VVGTRSRKNVGREVAGKALKKARQQRRLSLDAIATTLRIPPKHLRSLEEGDLTVFAAEVYARGAYIKYARYLGVDKKRTYRAFLRLLCEARELVPLKVPRRVPWFTRVRTPAVGLMVSIGLVVAVIVGYIGWQVQSYLRLPKLDLIEPSVSILELDSVNVKGKAEEGANVKVNGETVLLKEDGAFEVEMPLRGGINVLQVEATGVSGRTNVVRKEILVPKLNS